MLVISKHNSLVYFISVVEKNNLLMFEIKVAWGYLKGRLPFILKGFHVYSNLKKAKNERSTNRRGFWVLAAYEAARKQYKIKQGFKFLWKI